MNSLPIRNMYRILSKIKLKKCISLVLLYNLSLCTVNIVSNVTHSCLLFVIICLWDVSEVFHVTLNWAGSEILLRHRHLYERAVRFRYTLEQTLSVCSWLLLLCNFNENVWLLPVEKAVIIKFSVTKWEVVSSLCAQVCLACVSLQSIWAVVSCEVAVSSLISVVYILLHLFCIWKWVVSCRRVALLPITMFRNPKKFILLTP